MKPRYYVSAWHGEVGTIFTVIDSHTGRAKGQTSTWRDGVLARRLADIQAHALIYAHNTRQLQRRATKEIK